MNVISLTALPSRLGYIDRTIESLANQDTRPDAIYLWLPKRPLRDSCVVDRIPDAVARSGVTVDFVDDVGPATKLLPALKKHWNDKRTIIVTADDDQIYPPHWFGCLLAHAGVYTNACLGYRGKRFLRIGNAILSHSYNTARFYFGHKIERPVKVDIVTGNWGALYRVGFFGEEVFELDLGSPMAYTDDIWFSGLLAKNGIDRYVVPSKSGVCAAEQWRISSLYELNKDGKNNNWSIRRFRGHFA